MSDQDRIIFKGKLTPSRLRAARYLARVEKKELSRRTGFSVHFINMVEEGWKKLDADKLGRWLKALGVCAEDPVLRVDAIELGCLRNLEADGETGSTFM